ncbi:hypothetical protein GH714_000239 [Hevea brasiliensis]|uniref:Uncharacterized protein n=1 Tax=Hevea brasiliensis TaxID=3981 RepID=A0A6A6M5W9_HEVBR|nr:hypothetical protein GH714_000239 [Hevea brasiliensis]
MAATSGALLNGLGSSFLCGGKRTQALRVCEEIKREVVQEVCGCVLLNQRNLGSWCKAGGNFVDPEWLDGSLRQGSSIPQMVQRSRAYPWRWAMTAVVGIFAGQAWSGIPWFEAGADPGAIAPFSFGSLLGTQLLLMGWVESRDGLDFFNPDSQSVEWATPWSRTAENFANATGEQGTREGNSLIH